MNFDKDVVYWDKVKTKNKKQKQGGILLVFKFACLLLILH